MKRLMGIGVRIAVIALALGLLSLTTPAAMGQDPASPRHPGLVESVGAAIQHEMRDKAIPAIAIAIVDEQGLVWSEGFGEARPGVAASPTTVWRVGSVSKLFTDLAVMQLVEQGKLSLDAPITDYLPEFKPENPYNKAITLRQLMSHRSGLVREPPVGNYFDDSGPKLANTVASLNGTRLVYEPETRTKYSNAGIGVVGFVVERVTGTPFAEHIEQTLFRPLGMSSSTFAPNEHVNAQLAGATMWSYDGRTFAAPPIQMGMAPAGNLYASMADLSKFLSVLVAGGEGIVTRESFQTMLRPQFTDKPEGFGLGFSVGQFQGRQYYSHGGAIYGFSTHVAFLPADKFAVAIASNVDVTNAVIRRIVDHALSAMIAISDGVSIPVYDMPGPVDAAVAESLAGTFYFDDERLDVDYRAGDLFAHYGTGRYRVRSLEGELFIDDRLRYGTPIRIANANGLAIADRLYTRALPDEPAAPPDRWRGLIGEYGWDHNILFVHERHGRLYALVEWIEFDALDEVSENVFAFPQDAGMYHGEQLVFTRDASGRATEVVAAGVRFPRRNLSGEGAETFHITPLRPVAELREAAIAATPPVEPGPFRSSDLVDVVTLDLTIKTDVRYYTGNNFMRAPFYSQARVLLQRPAAEALARAHRSLVEQGYGLLLFDGYRPWFVTKMFWDATPEDKKLFVADPAEGSRHNRGCAIDLTLYALKTGQPVEMTGQYDEMSERSFPEYQGGTAQQRWLRELLRSAMESAGFTVYPFEWWHFDYKDWKEYGILNQTFESVP